MAESSFNAAPVGAGPFVLAAIDSKEARLAVNPGYHGNKPWIQTFTLRFFPDYPSAVRSFMAGEIDGALVREPLSESQEADVGKVKGSEVIRLQRAAFLVLYLNNDQVMFEDARVRRALSLALDRTTVVDRALAGLATASNSVIPPDSWAYVPDFDSTTTIRPRARRISASS